MQYTKREKKYRNVSLKQNANEARTKKALIKENKIEKQTVVCLFVSPISYHSTRRTRPGKNTGHLSRSVRAPVAWDFFATFLVGIAPRSVERTGVTGRATSKLIGARPPHTCHRPPATERFGRARLCKKLLLFAEQLMRLSLFENRPFD